MPPARTAGRRLGYGRVPHAACLARCRGLGSAAAGVVGARAPSGWERQDPEDRGRQVRAGDTTGRELAPGSVERGRSELKHQLITDARGLLLAWSATPAKDNDITQRVPRLDVIKRVRGPLGRARRRPARVIADRGSDHDTHRRLLCARGIASSIACRDTGQRCGLGRECEVTVCALSHRTPRAGCACARGVHRSPVPPRSAWPAACRAPAAAGAHPVRAS